MHRAALSEFDRDSRCSSDVWEKNDRPQNVIKPAAVSAFRPPGVPQDLGTFTTGITQDLFPPRPKVPVDYPQQHYV